MKYNYKKCLNCEDSYNQDCYIPAPYTTLCSFYIRAVKEEQKKKETKVIDMEQILKTADGEVHQEDLTQDEVNQRFLEGI